MSIGARSSKCLDEGREGLRSTRGREQELSDKNVPPKREVLKDGGRKIEGCVAFHVESEFPCRERECDGKPLKRGTSERMES